MSGAAARALEGVVLVVPKGRVGDVGPVAAQGCPAAHGADRVLLADLPFAGCAGYDFRGGAVVGSEQDQRPAEFPGAFEVGDESAQILVYAVDHGGIDGHPSCLLFSFSWRQPGPIPEGRRRAWIAVIDEAGIPHAPVPGIGDGRVAGFVTLQVPLDVGWPSLERIVRGLEGEIEEEWRGTPGALSLPRNVTPLRRKKQPASRLAVSICFMEVLRQQVERPVRIGIGGVEVLALRRIALNAFSVEAPPASLRRHVSLACRFGLTGPCGEPRIEVVRRPGAQPRIAVEPKIQGMVAAMVLAHHEGPISCRAQRLGDGDAVANDASWRFIHADLFRIPAGQQGAPGRETLGGGVELREAQPARGEPVDVRGCDLSAERPHVRPAHVVNQYQDHIGPTVNLPVAELRQNAQQNRRNQYLEPHLFACAKSVV